jgi:sigma-E factor negative regulatory protein RseB
MRKTLTLLALLIPACALAQAVPGGGPDASAWLKKIYTASQKLSYTGTFVYRQGDRSET